MSEASAPPEIGAPHMFGDEPKLFERVLSRGVKRYLEWGVGGSTLAAVRAGVHTIVSVDSDREWVAAVRRHGEIAPKVERGEATVIHADIGPTREWGNPKDDSHIQRWPEYLAAAWDEWDRRRALPDLVFVDGRFRVACCYSVALICADLSLEQTPLVLMHDIVEERPSYCDAFEFFELKEQVGSLVLMSLQRPVSRSKVFARLVRRQFDNG